MADKRAQTWPERPRCVGCSLVAQPHVGRSNAARGSQPPYYCRAAAARSSEDSSSAQTSLAAAQLQQVST
eukprot:scaffold2933_cov245-Pinguiococcus_pyrenoidosus.AAC.1